MPPDRRSFARWTRFRSPPERSFTSFCWSPPRKLNHETYWRELTSRLPSVITSWLPEISFQTVFCPSRALRDWIDVRELDGLAHHERAGVRLLLAGDHPEEGRLAGAVRPDHADDPAGGKVERQVLHQEPVAEALLDVLGPDDDVAEPRPGRDVDLDRVDPLRLVLGEELS